MTLAKVAAQLRRGMPGHRKIGAMSTLEQISCCPGASAHEGYRVAMFGKYL